MAEFVYLTPDEYRALRERIDRAESSTTHWKSETLHLRARLAEVEAERDRFQQAANDNYSALRVARAKLAEAEAERDRLDAENMTLQRMCSTAEGRLAAVLALCDEADRRDPIAGMTTVARVRAAAAGDDR